jgi:hypothetical protein
MPRVVPSQVVELIDLLFPDARQQKEGDDKFMLTVGNAPAIAGILDLVQQIPHELLTVNQQQYGELVVSVRALRTVIDHWHSRGDYGFRRVPGLRHLNPITLIRQALVRCADQAPTQGTAELTFIQDTDFRESLRRDVSAANNALRDGEWKAATVLAGSVVEALLLWALQQKTKAEITASVGRLIAAAILKKKPSTNVENWGLDPLIEVAAELKVINANTAVLTREAKDYRNLIHPGRTVRLGQTCNRGTALAAVAAFEFVVRDVVS